MDWDVGVRVSDGPSHGVGPRRVGAPSRASVAAGRLLAPLLAAAALVGVACGGDDADGPWTAGPIPGEIGFNAGGGAGGGGGASACRIRLSGAVTRVLSCGASTSWDGTSGHLEIWELDPVDGSTDAADIGVQLDLPDKPAARTYSSKTARIRVAVARASTADGWKSWQPGPRSESFTLAFSGVTEPVPSGSVVTYTAHGRVHLVLSAPSSAGSAARDLTLDVRF